MNRDSKDTWIVVLIERMKQVNPLSWNMGIPTDSVIEDDMEED